MESSRSSRSSSPADERRCLDLWQPEPLVPDIDPENYQHILKPHVISSKPGKYIIVDGKECLNLGTHNYLGLAEDPRLEESSIEALRKYGVGSCGPRAFYGTMDVHLKLEDELAKFLELQEVVLYSFGFSTIASAIPAYAKSSDIIFVDEYCNFAIQKGMAAARCKVIKFKHNDIQDLEIQIKEFFEDQLKNKSSKRVRTFLLVEGIYARTGDICPLKELIYIKEKYKIRLFIDESRSFGILGNKGKGVTEHFNVDRNDVDLIMSSLENAFCAFGGFCAGSTFVVDHQRLAGSGYCFSASLPPLQARVALESLKIIREDPHLITYAREKFQYAQQVLTNLTILKNISHPLSPVKILVIKSTYESSVSTYNKQEERLLKDICAKILTEEKIAISVARYMEEEEMTAPTASIRLIVSACLTHEDIDRVYRVIEKFSRVLASSELINVVH